MQFTSEFVPLPLEELRRQAAVMKADGWRFVQTHAVNTESGVDLYYSFMKDGAIVNYRVAGITPDDQVPSITDLFLAAFVFENEARELFGVDMRDIVLDFQGAMYAPAVDSPMTFISPEQKAAREKARKAAAAKAAKEEKAAQAQGSPDAPAQPAAPGKRVFVMTPELQARLDAKMPALSDEKKAKVEAALKARAAEAEAEAAASAPAAAPAKAAEQAAPARPSDTCEAEAARAIPDDRQAPTDYVLEAKLSGMDPAKAAKVRAALGGRAGEAAESVDDPPSGMSADEQVDRLLNIMDDEKAAKVLQALARKGGE